MQRFANCLRYFLNTQLKLNNTILPPIENKTKNFYETYDLQVSESLFIESLLPLEIFLSISDISNLRTNLAHGPVQRQAEFVLGRRMAFAALSKAGFVDAGDQTGSEPFREQVKRIVDDRLTIVVGSNSDRSPSWPHGFVGSISHSRRWCMAIAAKTTSYRSIGIDTEVIVPQEMADSLLFYIGRATEWNLFRDAGLEMPSAFTLLFSAKEAFYKCLYPLRKKVFEFLDVFAFQIEPVLACRFPNQRAGVLSLRLIEDKSISLEIRYLIKAEDVFTIATIKALR